MAGAERRCMSSHRGCQSGKVLFSSSFRDRFLFHVKLWDGFTLCMGITVHFLEQWFRSKRTVLKEGVWGLLSPKLCIYDTQRESWACAVRGLADFSSRREGGCQVSSCSCVGSRLLWWHTAKPVLRAGLWCGWYLHLLWGRSVSLI